MTVKSARERTPREEEQQSEQTWTARVNVATDEALIKKFRAGDRGAFAQLVSKYERPLVNFLYRMTGDAGRAEELFQESFLRVFKHAGRFDTSRKFKTWLYTIASNLARNELRRRGKELPLTGVPASTGPGPQEKLESKEVEESVRGAVALLPEDQRLVLTMRIYQELTYEEIGEILGCSTGTAKSRMFYAMEKLRRHLEYLAPGGCT